MPPNDHARSRLDGSAMAVLTVLCMCWGLNQVSVKLANEGVTPFTQAAIRSFGAAILLVAWARWRSIPLFGRDGTLVPGLIAGALFGLEFLLIYWGLVYTTASRAIIFVYAAPFVVAVGAHLFIPGDRLNRVRLCGLFAALGGVILAFADKLSLPSPRALIGDAMCLGGAIAWGATTVLIKATRLSRIPAEKTLFYQLAVSGAMLAAAALASREAGVFAPSPLVVASVVYQTAIVAFASYTTWFWLMARYPASLLASFSFLPPVFGVVAGGIILREPMGIKLFGAVALIALGIYLVNRPTRC